jgi:hypothetical protein
MKSRYWAALALAITTVATVHAQGTPAAFAQQQYFTAGGLPNAGGSVCTTLSGTSTPALTYSDFLLTQPNATCVVLNSGGYPASGGIWMVADLVYRFVLKDNTGVTIWTVDGIPGSGSGALIGGALFTLNGTTINNLQGPSTRVCISSTPCSAALALLDVAGSSSGQSFLERIDDAANQPGINFYGSGNSLGAIEGTFNGLQLLSGDLFSQIQVASGVVTVQNTNPAGGTSLNVTEGAAQGANNLMNFITFGGLTEAFVDVNGGFAGAYFNSTATGSGIAFQNSNSLFSVNGFGDGTFNGQVNVVGVNDSANGGGNAAVKINGLTVIDNAGNATFTTLTCTGSPCGTGGGGGGGSPGGLTTNVQFNNSGAFGGSANFIWNNTSQLLTVTAASSSVAGIVVATGFIQSAIGFLATPATATNYNAFQATAGGMEAISFTATKYLQSGNSSGAPTPTTGDSFHAGALYWDTGSAAEQVYNGSAWVSLGGGSGTPGGSNTNVQFNSSGSFGGSGNFIWNNGGQFLTITAANSSSPGLAVGTGFVQADAGFLATTGTATNYNAIQAPGGGMASKSFTATKYVQTGSGAAPPTATTGDTINPGALFWNTSSGQEQVFNGSAWTNLGGSGGSPGGSNTNVQFNSGGGFGGSGNLTYATQLLTSIATSSASPGMYVQTGFMQADSGFLATTATAIQFNSIQAPGGGVFAKSLRAANYTQGGNNSGIPPLTSGDSFQPGALYFNTSLGVEQVFNGASWVSLSGGGGSGITSIAGTTNQVFVNGGTAAVSSGPVTLSLPQAICATCSPQFTSLTVALGITSGSHTTTNTIGNSYTSTSNSSNSYSSSGGYTADATGGSASAFTVGGNSVINSLGQFVGPNGINTIGASTFGSSATFNGGINLNFATNSNIYIGNSGNFYNRVVSNSAGISCGGITDGWMSTTSDGFVVVCLSGSRFRATLASY